MAEKNLAEIVHPDYAKFADRWRMADAFDHGGLRVLKPDFDATLNRVPVAHYEEEGGTPSELTRPISHWSWTTNAANSFIWRHFRETAQEYKSRQERAINFPVFRGVNNIFTAGILGKPPRLDGIVKGGVFDAYLRDIDMCGTGLDEFRRMVLRGGLRFGRYHALTDRPRFAVEAASLGEQLARNERPYSYFVSPLEMPDWSIDGYGQFVWVKIAEPYYRERSPMQIEGPAALQFRIWYRDHWEVHVPTKIENGDGAGTVTYELYAEGPNPLGRVPLRTFTADWDGRRFNMACESPFCDVLDVNRDAMNKLSELDEMERSQSFAMLFLPGSPPGGLNIGPMRAFGGGDSGLAPQYIYAPAELTNSKWARILAKLQAIVHFVGASRGEAENSREERSAEAIGAEGADKRNQMAIWAGSMETFENGIYRDVADWAQEPSAPTVAYPRSFDLKSVASQVQELVSLAGSQVLTRFAAVRMAIPVVEKALRDGGASPDYIEAVTTHLMDIAETPEIHEVGRQPGMDGTPSTRGPVPDGEPVEPAGPGEDSQRSAARAAAQEKLLGTVGALTGVIDLNRAVSERTMTREAAIAVLVNMYGMAAETAGTMISEPEEKPEEPEPFEPETVSEESLENA